MSTQINAKCIDQTLVLTGTPLVASGGKNEDTVIFTFCEKWDGFLKTAVFYCKGSTKSYEVLLEDDKCYVPQEVLVTGGIIYIGVLGVKGEEVRTSEVIAYQVIDGVPVTITAPTVDIYQQLMNKYQEMMDKAKEIDENEKAFETKITNQQSEFEEAQTSRQNTFEENLNSQWSTYKTDLTNQQNNYETNLTKKEGEFESSLNSQWSTFKSDTDAEIKEKLSHVYRPCGSVANYEALPTDAEIGDVYNLLDTGVNWAWTGTEWDSLAGIIDLSNFYNKTEVDTKLNAEITNRTNADSTLQSNIDKKVNTADIVDNLTSSNTDKPLSANQGKVLKGEADKKINKTDIADNLTTDDSTKVLSARQGKTLNESKQGKTIIYSNIVVGATPTALSDYCVWDTQQKYGYKATVEIDGLTVNSLIQNIIMTDTLLESVACIVTTETNSLTFYTESADALSGNIYTLAVSEV